MMIVMTMIMEINIHKALYIIKGQNKHLNICQAITVFLHNMLKRIKELKGVLHPRSVFGLFLHFSQKLQHIGNK